MVLRALRLGPPVRFLVGPSSGGADRDAGLEWTCTGGADEGAGAGVKLKDPWGTDEVAGFEAKLKDPWGAEEVAGAGVKLKDPWGADVFAGFDAKLKDDAGPEAGGATLLLLSVELTPAVATLGPAGGFHLGSSQGASYVLASRRILVPSPGRGGRLRQSSGLDVEGASSFHSLRNLDGPAGVDW